MFIHSSQRDMDSRAQTEFGYSVTIFGALAFVLLMVLQPITG